jgi:Tfp pilus assembly protein PilF
MSFTDRLQSLVDAGRDAPHIRVSLAEAAMGQGNAHEAINHLEQALKLDPNYTAAWKAYGRALHMERRDAEARKAYQRGIEVAHAAGDRQAVREMEVFLRRLDK